MNGKELFLDLTFIDSRFIAEAETAIPQRKQGRTLPRKLLLVAAILALSMLLVGCGTVVYHLVIAESPLFDLPRLEASQIDPEDILLQVEDASPSGICIQFDIEGLGSEEIGLIVLEDGPAMLEKQTETGWETVPRKMENPDWMPQVTMTDGHTQWYVGWSSIYGLLDAGIYRYTAQMLEGCGPLSVEFEIIPDMETPAMDTAEELMGRECYHLRLTSHSEYGSLENVPEAERACYQIPEPDYETWVQDYWKNGRDLMIRYYRDNVLWLGMLYKDGVKYNMAFEGNARYNPVIGWEVWTDMDMDRLTEWSVFFDDPAYEQTLEYDEAGALAKIILKGKQKDQFYDVYLYTTIVIDVMNTEPTTIAEVFAQQDTNTIREFYWEEDQMHYQPVDTAFKNTTPQPITNAAEAIARAEAECTVEDTNIVVYRDENAGMWKVEYQIMNGYQGYQYVYLNDDGLTVMVSGAGSKVGDWRDDYPGPQ